MTRLHSLLRCRLPTQCRRSFCSSKIKPGPIRSSPSKPAYVPSTSHLSSYVQATASPPQDISLRERFSLFIQSSYQSFKGTSFRNKLFCSSILGLILFGDYLDRQYVEYNDINGVYSFLADSPEEMLQNECRTGDIILFQRPILSFNPLNMLRTSFRQFACGGPYDHCGVVICNGHDSNTPYIIEIDQNYYNKLRITPFDKRIITAREVAIFTRKVRKIRINDKMHTKLSDWIDYKVNDEEHYQKHIDEIEEFLNTTSHKRDSLFSILLCLCWNGDNTIKIRSQIRDLTRKILQNEYEITTQIEKEKTGQVVPHKPNIGQSMFDHTRHGRVKDVTKLIKETKMYKIQRQLKRENLKKREKKIKKSRKINSAQFVGYFWRFIGFLDENDAKPWELRPMQFSDSKIQIPMKMPARLGHVQFVKTANEDKKINDSERRYRGTTKQRAWESAESAHS